MLGKVDVSGIVWEHMKTLRSNRTGRISAADLVLFLIVPVLAAAGLVSRGFAMTGDGVNILLTSLSIFVGLLFNLLVLAHAMRGSARSETRTLMERRLMREINANLEYAILVSLVAICVLLVTVFAPSYAFSAASPSNTGRVVTPVLSWLTYVLTINFLLTLFMILKRMHSLLWMDYRELDADPTPIQAGAPQTVGGAAPPSPTVGATVLPSHG